MPGITAESEIRLILKILKINHDEDLPVATVSEAGLRYYSSHRDKRVRKAMAEYLAHPRSKPIFNSKKITRSTSTAPALI